MAGYCHGANAPYGCGHHAEHVRAAKLGWARRKGAESAAFEGSDEQRLASLFLGGEVRYAHTHSEHPTTVVFKQNGKWYELPKRVFASFVRGGREQERENQKRERAEKKRTRQELQYQLYQEQAAHNEGEQSRFHAALIKKLQRLGGVRPTYNRTTGKTYDRGEWLTLPASIRRTHGKLTLDMAREAAQEQADGWHMPLTFDTPDDLTNYFATEAYARERRAARRRSLRDQIAELRTPRQQKRSKSA